MDEKERGGENGKGMGGEGAEGYNSLQNAIRPGKLLFFP